MPFRTSSDVHHGGTYRSAADRPADSGWMDAAKSFGSGLLTGASGLIDMMGNYDPGGLGPQATEEITGQPAQPRHDFGSAANRIGADRQPQTTVGRYAKTGGEFAIGGLVAPGSIPARVAGTLLPALAFEGTGDAARAMKAGPKTTKAAQIGAALLTGSAVGLAGRAGTADRMLAEATSGATDAQIAQAKALMERGHALPNGGVRVTGDEALAKVTNGGTGVQKLSRAVTNTRKGGNRVAEALKERPAQVRNATMGTLDQIAPPIENPSGVGLRGQAAAEGAVRDVKAQRSAQVSPLYKAAGPKPVGQPPTLYRETSSDRALREFMPENRSTQDMRNNEVYMAEAPELALGQGENKGVSLEFDPTGLSTRPGPKPVPGESIAVGNPQGAYQGALRAFTIKNGAPIDQATAPRLWQTVERLESQGWKPTKTAEGTRWERPGQADSMPAVLRDIDASIAADKTGLVGGRLKQLRDLLAASPDVENVDRVRKFFRDRTELPIGSTDALTGEEAKAVGGFLQRLSNEQGSGLLDAVPEFAAGKQKYQDLSRTLVEPVTSGPVGRIATEATDLRADPVQQASRLYPSNPPEGSVNETVAALRSMGGQDPAIGADLTRLHLTNRFNETTQDLQGGQNMAGGAKFAADVAGNRAQEANLLGGLGEVAPQAKPTVEDLLEVLRATGMRGNEGSPTAGYQQFAKDLGVGEAPVELAKSVARPLGIPARVGGWLEQRALEGNSDKLLNVLLGSPDEFQGLLLDARRRAANTPMAQELARALTGSAAAQSGNY